MPFIASGRVRVTTNDRAVGELGPGDSFGEIALLCDVPRTATVQAIEPIELLAIEREPFLEALTGQPWSRVIAMQPPNILSRRQRRAYTRSDAAPS